MYVRVIRTLCVCACECVHGSSRARQTGAKNGLPRRGGDPGYARSPPARCRRRRDRAIFLFITNQVLYTHESCADFASPAVRAPNPYLRTYTGVHNTFVRTYVPATRQLESPSKRRTRKLRHLQTRRRTRAGRDSGARGGKTNYAFRTRRRPVVKATAARSPARRHDRGRLLLGVAKSARRQAAVIVIIDVLAGPVRPRSCRARAATRRRELDGGGDDAARTVVRILG